MADKKEKNRTETKKEDKKKSRFGKTTKIKLPNKVVIKVRKPNLLNNVFFYIFLAFSIFFI